VKRNADRFPADFAFQLEAQTLDSDLALLYGVTTKRFNEQFRRNRNRFPADFAFQLSREESDSLRSQFAGARTTKTADWFHSESE
jgi:hypothetical protein